MPPGGMSRCKRSGRMGLALTRSPRCADMTPMPRHIRLILIITGGWIAVCEAHALGLRWLPIGPQKWLHLVAMGIGAALCLIRAAVRVRERAAWLLIGLGVLAWAVGGWRVDRRFGVIAAGVICFWTADTIYLIKAAEGTWVSGGPYDPGWWTIRTLMVMKAARVRHHDIRPRESVAA